MDPLTKHSLNLSHGMYNLRIVFFIVTDPSFQLGFNSFKDPSDQVRFNQFLTQTLSIFFEKYNENKTQKEILKKKPDNEKINLEQTPLNVNIKQYISLITTRIHTQALEIELEIRPNIAPIEIFNLMRIWLIDHLFTEFPQFQKMSIFDIFDQQGYIISRNILPSQVYVKKFLTDIEFKGNDPYIEPIIISDKLEKEFNIEYQIGYYILFCTRYNQKLTPEMKLIIKQGINDYFHLSKSFPSGNHKNFRIKKYDILDQTIIIQIIMTPDQNPAFFVNIFKSLLSKRLKNKIKTLEKTWDQQYYLITLEANITEIYRRINKS